VVHGDEDLVQGGPARAWPPPHSKCERPTSCCRRAPTGTLESLGYDELTRWLTQAYEYVRAAIA